MRYDYQGYVIEIVESDEKLYNITVMKPVHNVWINVYTENAIDSHDEAKKWAEFYVDGRVELEKEMDGMNK